MKIYRKFLTLAVLSLFFVTSIAPNIFAQEMISDALPKASNETDRLYLDFKGAALINVLMILSELSGINFVAGKEVANREVNMVLDNVSIENALDAIGRGSNIAYDYFPDRNLYLFRAAADKEDQPQLVTRVFKLYFIRASELREIKAGGGAGAGSSSSGTTFTVLSETKETGESSSSILKIVESILSERGKVKVDDRSNSLVVTDTEDRLKMIEQAVAELDRPVDQVLIKVILIETFEDLDRFLGIEWGSTTTGQEGSLGVITGGSQLTRFPFNVNEYDGFARLFGKTSLTKTPVAEADNVLTTEGSKSFTDLTVRFRALQTAGKLRVIAKPKILVLDNHPALIKITTNEAVGNQTNTLGDTTTGITSTTAERTETGTSLRVTPLINTDNRITMTLEPSFVTAAASASGAAQTRDPTIRSARTTLMVRSGQTIVMGGLLSSQQTNAVRKLPILGDIPYVGEIFTRRTTQVDDRELMLFITPIIVRDPSEVQAVNVPDQRDRFDDLIAPFWKWKRKNWYKNLKAEPAVTEASTENIYIPAREQLMDETMAGLAREQQKPKAESKQEEKPAVSKASSSSLTSRAGLAGTVS